MIAAAIPVTPVELDLLRNVLGSRADKAVEAGRIRLENNDAIEEVEKNE